VGLPGIVLVVISISLSAMTYWAVTFQSNLFSLTGLIMILVGAAGTLVSAFVFSMSRSSENAHHTLDRQISDLKGGVRSFHHGTNQLTLRVLSSATARLPRQILPARGTGDCRSTSLTARRY
jgi:hypothetical protein